MGIFRRRKDTGKKVQYIIKEYYGGDVSSFVYTYASSIYSIPEVRTAIETMADIFATIPIYHKKQNKDGSAIYLEDDIYRTLSLKPNELQNASQFWKTTITQYLLNSNIFIEPVYGYRGELKAIYPLPLKYFDLILDEPATVRFYDKPRGSLIEEHKLNDLIYINRFSSLRKGESVNLGLYETVIQALSNQIISITNPKKVKALLQGKQGYTGNLKPEHQKSTMDKFKASLDENVDGVAYIDPQWTITSVDWHENDVNRDLMAFVINVVYNYFGITESIINNKCTEIEREMFIATRIKPLAQQFAQEFTYKLFTEEEIKAGHQIEFDVFALSVSTLQAKNSLFNTAARNGILNIDEMREMIGQPSLPNGEGKVYRASADCVDIRIVDKYQLGKVGEKVSTDNKQSDDINKQKKEESEQDAQTE